jgi:membrane protein DedA with SNARE-associated domain
MNTFSKTFSFFKKQFLENWYLLLIFIFAFSFLFLIKFIWGHFSLPNSSELVVFLQNFLLEHGLLVVFLSAIVESILFLGGYFPGTIIIFLSLSITGETLLKIFETVLTATFGMIIGYSIDYFIGKYGALKILKKLNLEKDVEKLKSEIQKNGASAGFLLYILPGFGAIVSTTFGIIAYDFKKFLAFLLITLLIWNSIWGIVGFIFGDSVLKIITSGYLGFVILFVWFLFFIFSGKYKEFKEKMQNN